MTGVTTTHADYDKFAPVWKKMRDVIAGQRAIHMATEEYLPKLSDEQPDQYTARLKRSNFTNFTWRTIDGFKGMLFRKAPAQDVPTGIEPYLDDITMSGMSMETFAKLVAFEDLAIGRVGVLVDHPEAPENVAPITVDTAQKMGLRPNLKLYQAESIINWEYRRIANATVLGMVVLKECETVKEDEFTIKTEDRWRVLDLDPSGNYRQRVFKRDKEQDVLLSETYPLMNGKPLDRIPFWIDTPDGEECELDDPPLVDLADANIAYYQVNSDRRHGLHFTGLPMLFLAGVHLDPGQSIRVGTQMAITSTDPQAKGSYIEFTGQGLNAIKDYMAELRQEMAVLGARMLADETGQVETLGATQIKRTGENSILANIANSTSDVLEGALTLFAQWAGQAGEVTYQLNREFSPTPMDAQTLTALVSSWQAGAISGEELFDTLQRGDVIDGEKTFEEHQAQVDVQAPPAPAKPANDPTQVAA